MSRTLSFVASCRLMKRLAAAEMIDRYLKRQLTLQILGLDIILDNGTKETWRTALFTNIPPTITQIYLRFSSIIDCRNLHWTVASYGTTFLACLDVLPLSRLRRLKRVSVVLEDDEWNTERVQAELDNNLGMTRRGLLHIDVDDPYQPTLPFSIMGSSGPF